MVNMMKKYIQYLLASAMVAGALAVVPMTTGVQASAEQTPGVTIGDVDNALLVVNHAVGAGKSSAMSIEVDVNFTQNVDKLTMGLVPTNNKDDLVATNITGHGYANSDYVMYWHNGSEFLWSGMKNNAWTEDGNVNSIQEYMVGEMSLKLTIAPYGTYEMAINVPSSNTTMADTVQRDTWITVGNGGLGTFKEYDVAGREGADHTGYLFFKMKNVEFYNITITPDANWSAGVGFSDDFSSASSFSTNYITNDAFDAGVFAGTVVVPQRDAIDVSNLQTYYYSHDEITFAPTIYAAGITLDDLTMSVTKDGVPVTDGVNGLKFTPAEDGEYELTFATADGTQTATHTIVVLDMPEQGSINTKFEGTGIVSFASENVTVESGKATLAQNAYFGTKGRAKNFVQMVRITSVSADATDFTLYFGKQTATAMYKVTFTKGSTSVSVTDGAGTSTKDIGVDVFNVTYGDGLVVQMKKVAGNVELSLTYGNLPMETLNEPVASFGVNAPLVGQMGISSVSGGVEMDRYVLINYTGNVEIEDEIVEDIPVDSSEESANDSQDSNGGAQGGASKKGCGCGSVVGIAGVVTLLPLAFMALRKRKE